MNQIVFCICHYNVFVNLLKAISNCGFLVHVLVRTVGTVPHDRNKGQNKSVLESSGSGLLRSFKQFSKPDRKHMLAAAISRIMFNLSTLWFRFQYWKNSEVRSSIPSFFPLNFLLQSTTFPNIFRGLNLYFTYIGFSNQFLFNEGRTMFFFLQTKFEKETYVFSAAICI